MVLGDNIFAGHGLNRRLRAAVENAENGRGATVFGYFVDDPERFGLVEFDQNGKAISINDVCLLEISRMREAYESRVKSIGFFGHHLGIAVDVAAYTLGTNVIERHY